MLLPVKDKPSLFHVGSFFNYSSALWKSLLYFVSDDMSLEGLEQELEECKNHDVSNSGFILCQILSGCISSLLALSLNEQEAEGTTLAFSHPSG